MLSGATATEALRIHDDGNLTVSGDLTITGGNITNAITFDTSFALDSAIISTIQTGSESFADNDTSLMTSAAIQDKIEAYGYTTSAGLITGVTAGVGLSGGGTTGDVTLTVDISEFSDVTPANGDKLLTLDSDGTTEQLKIGRAHV